MSVEFNIWVKLFAERIAEVTGAKGPDKIPTIPEFTEALRLDKIKTEEDWELTKALGIDRLVKGPGAITKDRVYYQKNENGPDMIEIADGIADSIFTSYFMAIMLGIDIEPFLIAVAKNNLEKFGPGGYLNDEDKWVKPTGHVGPDIKGILEAQGYED